MLKVYEVGYKYKDNRSIKVENVVAKYGDEAIKKIVDRDYREADAIGIGDTIVFEDYEFIYTKVLVLRLVV